MDSPTAWRVRRVVLGWCVGGGAILERREVELSQRALYRRQRAAMERRIFSSHLQTTVCSEYDRWASNVTPRSFSRKHSGTAVPLNWVGGVSQGLRWRDTVMACDFVGSKVTRH